MSKIIYIAGLGHSGSTILDMSLGTLSNVVGLGELKTLLDKETRQKHFKSQCSCGKFANDCEFWKDFSKIIDQKHAENEKYESVLTLLKEKYDNDICLVDSSKNSYSYLKYLNENHDLKLIYLTRDIRSWTYARHLSTGKPVLYFIARWVLENIKLIHQIKKMGILKYNVGYEELSNYPEFVLRKICDFTGIKYSDTLLTPDKTHSHIISGNVARADQEKRARWMYDIRWMLSKRIMLYGPLFSLWQGRNKKYVYSNVKNVSMKDFHIFGTHRKKTLNSTFN